MTDDEPVQLVEDEATGDRFLVYGTERGLRLDIRYEGETLWMTQAQMAQLFGVDRSVITKHLANVYAEGELDTGQQVQRLHKFAKRVLAQLSGSLTTTTWMR